MQSHRQALLLSCFTVGYNILEGVVSIVFAVAAGSSALLGFGVDSFVESLSGLVMVWRFSGESGEHRELTAVRLTGCALLVLAAYVLYASAAQLYFGEEPKPSPVGIAIAVVSLLVMPALLLFKHRAAKAVQSRSLLADAKQTLGCICLSVALLFGLGLNFLFGWWQADPISGIIIAAFLAREGYRALTERELCCS
ncbi:MAG: cation transporter [Planctomycetia bacterium]|nr:cation transporter [Planctomycetia bacterium]